MAAPGRRTRSISGGSYDKTITPTTALILNGGYDINQTNGSKTQTGFEDIVVTGKWQAYTNAAHEFVVSLGHPTRDRRYRHLAYRR